VGQKEAFRDTACFLSKMDVYRKKKFIKHLFKAVGDRAGPNISERPHNDGEPRYRRALEPIGLILRNILSKAYENIKEEK